MRRGICVLAAAIVLVSGWPQRAGAWRTAADLPEYPSDAAIRWETEGIRFSVVRRAPAGWSEASFLQVVSLSAEEWSTHVCGPEVEDVGVPGGRAVSGDGTVTFEYLQRSEWQSRGLDATAGATTDVVYAMGVDGTWTITDADVYINGSLDWTGSEHDLRATLIHEWGHVLGILHCCELDGRGGAPTCESAPQCDAATMHPVQRGEAERRISEDDEGALCFLYSSEPCQGEGCVCSAATDCQDGLECRDERCGPVGPADPSVSCVESDDCPGGYRCSAGRCEPLSLGDPCSAMADCPTGVCADGACSTRCLEAAGCPAGYRCATERGVCEPTLETFGGACESASDCRGERCLTSLMSAAVCTRDCSIASPCPADWECDAVGGASVCVPQPVPGCGVAQTGLRARMPAWLLAVLLAAFIRNRRRR